MDIKSINEFIKFDRDLDIYNLIEPTLIYILNVPRGEVIYKNFTVEEQHEMRIDIIFRDMYDLEPNEVGIYLNNIDIILFINNIDNPLNIKRGMNLIYPNIEDFDKFRFNESSDLFTKKQDIKSRLVVPNKSTRVDKNRKKFNDNGFSLPPVVLSNPRPPVRIENGRFSVGGL